MTVATGNEVQTVTITGAPEGGDYTVDFDGEVTAPIAPDVSSAAFKSALVALPNVATADVAVSGSAGGPYTVTFGGAYEDTNVPQLIADGSGLTGGTNPDVEVTTDTAGNPPANETAYVDISEPNGTVANLQVLPGQTPPAGKTLVDASDYYGGS